MGDNSDPNREFFLIGVGVSTLALVILLALNPKLAPAMNELMKPLIGWMIINVGIFILLGRHLVKTLAEEKVKIKEWAKVEVEGLKFVVGAEVKLIDKYKFDELVETYRIKEYKQGYVLLNSNKGSSSQVSLEELVEKYQAV